MILQPVGADELLDLEDEDAYVLTDTRKAPPPPEHRSQLNIMLIGQRFSRHLPFVIFRFFLNEISSGLGKSTFINTLLDREVIPLDSSGIAKKTLDFAAYHDELCGDNHIVEITIWDTPGYGDDTHLFQTWGKVATFIEDKYRQYSVRKTSKVSDG